MSCHTMQESFKSSDSGLDKFFTKSTKKILFWKRRNDDSWTHRHEAVMEPFEFRESSDNNAIICLIMRRELSVDSVSRKANEMRERVGESESHTQCSNEDKISSKSEK
jgi:hypothetical protein